MLFSFIRDIKIPIFIKTIRKLILNVPSSLRNVNVAH
jgi:hypothetical protein